MVEQINNYKVKLFMLIPNKHEEGMRRKRGNM